MTLTKTDKRVLRMFADGKADTSKHLTSDGARLDLCGGYRVAHWSGGKLHFDPTYGNVSQTVAKATARAVAPMDIAADSQWILPETTRKRIAKRNPATIGEKEAKRTRAFYARTAKRNPAYAGRLFDYRTGEDCGAATAAQVRASKAAAKRDGGAGVIVVNMRSVFAEASPSKARETYPFAKPAKRNPGPPPADFYTASSAVGSAARAVMHADQRCFAPDSVEALADASAKYLTAAALVKQLDGRKRSTRGLSRQLTELSGVLSILRSRRSR